MKKFVCSVCGYVYEGEAAPEKCPQCGAPASKFTEQSGDMTWASEHVVGVAKGVSEDILEELRANFTIGGYIFYALCEAIAKSDMLMLSEIDPNFVKDLNIDSYKNIDELLEKVDFEGKDVCILPYGGSVVPLLQK